MRNLLYIALCVIVSCKSKEQIQADCKMKLHDRVYVTYSAEKKKYAIKYTGPFGVKWLSKHFFGELLFTYPTIYPPNLYYDSCAAKSDYWDLWRDDHPPSSNMDGFK